MLHDWTLAANCRVKLIYPRVQRAAMIGIHVCSKGKRRPFNRPVSSVRFYIFNIMEIPGSTGWMLISLPLPDIGTMPEPIPSNSLYLDSTFCDRSPTYE